MIVKKHSFKVSSSTLYGVGGGVFGVITVGMMIQSHLAPDTYPTCAERYGNAAEFALQRSTGKLMTAVELQSKLGGREWGVLQNVAIKAEKTPVSDQAMTIKFRPGGRSDLARRQADSGAGFRWQTGFLNKASAACLSYAVKVPANFKFGNGGTLPGLSGGKPYETDDVFSARMRWLEAARVGIHPVTPKRGNGHLMPLAQSWLKLPRDEWFSIEQEIVLNTPGKADGELRVWVDAE